MTRSQVIISVRFASTADEAREWASKGYTPIECAFGADIVVNEYEVDHHGHLSNKDPVALQALRLRRKLEAPLYDFVVTGDADADACFAILVLSGQLPENERVQKVAEAIAIVDNDPNNYDWEQDEMAPLIATFEEQSSKEQDASAFTQNLALLLGLILTPNEELIKASYDAFIKRKNAPPMIEKRFGDKVGFLEGQHDDMLRAYALVPVVVAKIKKAIVVGVKNEETATKLFGDGGLMNIYPLLNEKIADGWGGREFVGGSPRNREMTVDEGHEAAEILAEAVKKAVKK